MAWAVLQYGEIYKRNYYKEVKEKNRIHYELYSLDGTQEVPEDYKEISLVCIRKDGMYLGTIKTKKTLFPL